MAVRLWSLIWRMRAQFPDVVLDRLPLLKLEAPHAERRLRALAYLGPLVHLYTGRHELRVAPGAAGGWRALASRLEIQACARFCQCWLPGLFPTWRTHGSPAPSGPESMQDKPWT